MFRDTSNSVTRYLVGTVWGLKTKNSNEVSLGLYPTRKEARANKSVDEVVIKFELYTEYEGK